MRKPTHRRARHKMEPASSKDESKDQRFFGSEPEASFFNPAADVHLQLKTAEEEEQVELPVEQERENGEAAVLPTPEEEQEGP